MTLLVALTITILGLANTAHACGETVLNKNIVDSQRTLVATGSVSPTKTVDSRDPRIAYSELTEYAKKGSQQALVAAAVRRAAPSTGLIVRMRDKDGQSVKPLKPYYGGGWLIGSSCHVFMARHVVNELVKKDGEDVYTSRPPIGFKVGIGMGPGGFKGELVDGKVIMAGPSVADPGDDFAVVRLERKVQRTALISTEGLENYQAAELPENLVAMGWPADRQSDLGNPEIYIDPACHRLPNKGNASVRGIPTNCTATPGASGGLVMGVGRSSVLPMGSAVANPKLNSMESAMPGEDVYFYSLVVALEKWGPRVAEIILHDLARNPCN